MKKIITLFIILVLFFNPLFNCYARTNIDKTGFSTISPYIPPENSREELYQDIFMLFLLPYIEEEVNKYYKDYLTITPSVDPWGVNILNAYRVNGDRGFDFRLKLELHPYFSSHIDVGTDHITLRVNPVDNVKVEKFEHINSSKLPPYYQDYIKKKLP